MKDTALATPKLPRGGDSVKRPSVTERPGDTLKRLANKSEVEMVTATPTRFLVREFRPYAKNTLVGFLSLELPSGLIIHGSTLHEKNGSRWIGLRAKQYEKDGEKTWAPIIEFIDREVREAFQEYALEAVDAYLEAHE